MLVLAFPSTFRETVAVYELQLATTDILESGYPNEQLEAKK